VIGGAAYGLSQLFGTDALGVVVVTLLVMGLVAAAFGSRVRRGPAITAPTTTGAEAL